MAGLHALSDGGRGPELLLLRLGVTSRTVRLDATLRLGAPLALGRIIPVPLAATNRGARSLLGGRGLPGTERHESLCGLEVTLGGSDSRRAEVIAESRGGGGHGRFLTLPTRLTAVSNF